MGAGRSSSVDKIAAEKLRRMLSAGSSRVFDVVRLHREVKATGATSDEFLFRKDGLNNVIYIKEPFPDDQDFDEVAAPIGTKLYFAYNEKDAYEGGRSIFFVDPTFRTALHFHGGIDPDEHSEAVRHDLRILELLEEIPSLDPFLVKDRLDSEEIEAHEIYFEISEDEFARIRDFVMDRFRPMVEFAFQGSNHDSASVHLRTLVQKLWEGTDLDALGPILKALKLRDDEAPRVLYAWKGIIYYDYLFSSQQERWRDYATWMAKETVPTDVVPKPQRDELDALAGETRRCLQRRWKTVRDTLQQYHDAYDLLFRQRKDPGPFIEYMKGARQKFFELGDSISRVDHAIEVREGFIQNRFLTRLKFERLRTLLELSYRILE